MLSFVNLVIEFILLGAVAVLTVKFGDDIRSASAAATARFDSLLRVHRDLDSEVDARLSGLDDELSSLGVSVIALEECVSGPRNQGVRFAGEDYNGRRFEIPPDPPNGIKKLLYTITCREMNADPGRPFIPLTFEVEDSRPLSEIYAELVATGQRQQVPGAQASAGA